MTYFRVGVAGSTAYAAEEITAIGGWLIDGLSASKIALKLTDMRLGRDVSRNAIIGVVHRNKTLRAIGFDKSNGRGLNAERDGRKGGRKSAKAQRAPTTTKIRQSSRVAGVLAAPKPKKPAFDALNIAARLEGRAIAPKPRPAVPMVFECRGVPLVDLGRGECRWPINDPKPFEGFLFCGNHARPDRSYCRGHYNLSIGRGTESERSAGRFLAREAA